MLCVMCILFMSGFGYTAEMRPFHMGFTPWPYAPTIEALNSTNAFVTTNADILCEQIDESIPWDEALHGETFPLGFIKKMEEKQRRIGKGQTRVLYLTAMNTGRSGLLASYKDADHQADASWESKKFDDPDVLTAYTNYCVWMVKLFKPDYLVLGIETNEYLKNVPTDWDNYHAFSQKLHKEMKKRFPSLLLSESVTLHQLFDPKRPNPKTYTAKIKTLVNEQDFMAVSFYPYFLGMKSSADISGALDALRAFTKKPIAFVETGQPAETVDIPSLKYSYALTPIDQNVYLKTLLQHAQKDRYLFVIWWAHRDFDALWDVFPPEVKDLGRAWRDIGLLDENGKQRPAYTEWMKVLGRKYNRVGRQ